jgi:rhodanese-related sulfurtransferase
VFCNRSGVDLIPPSGAEPGTEKTFYRAMKLKTFLAVGASFLAAGWLFAANDADISLPDLKAVVDGKEGMILDVNGSDSYKAGHIPTAIDYVGNKDNIASLLPVDTNTLIVVYCANAQCSGYTDAISAANTLGYTNVKIYTGGIDGWKKSGQPVETDAP